MACDPAIGTEITVLKHLGHAQAKYLLGNFLIRPDSFSDTTPVHRETNAPRIAAPINGPVTHKLQPALLSPSDLSFIMRSEARCSARSCSMLAPVCLALDRSYAVSFGLVVLLSFALPWSPGHNALTQTPIPGK